MSQYTRIPVLVIGIMLLAPAQLLVTANHNDWFTSKYRDGIDDAGHEVPANTVPIPIDTEIGTGPCDYSMVLYSDTDTWHLDDGVPATVHTAPAGQNWMTPYGNSYWMWGSDQTAAGEYTFVRPVQLPANAYSIEARIQLGVNDFYKLYIQHGDGAISQHLDTDYSHSNSQQGEPTDLWTDDVAAGLNYFIFAANNSDSPDPDGNGTPGTAEGGLMFQIDIIYCRDSASNTGNCGGDNGDPIITDTYVSSQSTTMHRASGTNDPWVSTPNTPTIHSGWSNIPGNAEYLWPQVPNATDGHPGEGIDGRYEQGTFDFRMQFQVPAWAYAITAEFTGLTDNRFMPSSYLPLSNPSDSIIITKGTGHPDWAKAADSADDINNPPTTHWGTLNDASSTPDDYELLITARNRARGYDAAPTVGMIQYELVVIYCVGEAPLPPPCDEGDNYIEVQYASDLSVQYIDPDAAMTTSTATWASVYAPTQNGAWANPPSPGIWIWAGVDADGDGVFEDVGQGTFMFRHDFNVPQYAYDFNFAFNGMADNVILYDPLYGLGSGTDISITSQGALSIPLSSPLNLPLYLSPAPSNLPSAIVDHFNTNLAGTMMIPPTASNSQWDFAQETDLSLVVFARNRQSGTGSDTAGGLAYTLDVSYCEGTEEPDYPDVGDYNNRTKCTTYDGGFEEGIIFSSDTDTYYLDSGSWQATQPVDGSYSTGAPSNWGMGNYYWGVGYSSSYVYNPPLAHQSEWIWNAAYAKADGKHEFIRGFQLPSNVITAHARLFYSADERVVSAHITDQTGAIDYTPSGLENPGASITQYNDIFNTGSLVQLVNGANSPQAGDNLYLHIAAEDTEPNWNAYAQAPAAWGEYDYVDPAGLRYTLEVCFTVEETPPNDPPPTNCTQIDAPLVERTIVSGGGMYNTWHRDVGATTWINTPINPLTTNPIGNGDWVGTWPDMTAQWVWPQTDQPQANAYPSPHNDISGQVFEMRTLVTVPANAQIIQISFWGHADNRFIGPVEVTPDPLVANLPTQTLAVPPSGTDHHTSWQPMVSGGPIALPTIDPINVQEFEVTWSVSNRDLGGTTQATIGGVIWGIDLSYCEVEVGPVSDPDHTRDSGDDGDSIPGFTAVLLLSGVVLVAVMTNRRPRN